MSYTEFGYFYMPPTDGKRLFRLFSLLLPLLKQILFHWLLSALLHRLQ